MDSAGKVYSYVSQSNHLNRSSVLRILAIAEDGDVAQTIGTLLGASGSLDVELKSETEGWEALRRLGDGGFDAAIVDSRRVEEDALKLIALASKQRIDVPFILMVTDRDSDFGTRALNAGAADVLTVAEIQSVAFSHLMRSITEKYQLTANARADATAYQRRIEEQNRELTAALEELKNAQASVQFERLTAIEQLIVTVRHEVNNPLATLIGRAQLLRMRSRNVPDGVLQALEEIEQQAKRIRVIMDKLDLARDGRTTGYLDGRRIKLD
jgi:two-component system NtrC family sensor kinase